MLTILPFLNHVIMYRKDSIQNFKKFKLSQIHGKIQNYYMKIKLLINEILIKLIFK